MRLIQLCIFFVIQAKALAFKERVTYGSVLKLLNTEFKVRLHSHDIKYGTGSGQQSVTAIALEEDVNSHWVVKGPANKVVPRGTPVKCGDTLRLEHLATAKNLHSHHFSSPLSNSQEISAYGIQGEGDSGDNWIISCDDKYWTRDDEVMFKHVDTNVYLSLSGRQYSSPINGQLEVVGSMRSSHSAKWVAAEGIYLTETDPSNPSSTTHIHTEL